MRTYITFNIQFVVQKKYAMQKQISEDFKNLLMSIIHVKVWKVILNIYGSVNKLSINAEDLVLLLLSLWMSYKMTPQAQLEMFNEHNKKEELQLNV